MADDLQQSRLKIKKNLDWATLLEMSAKILENSWNAWPRVLHDMEG